MKTIEIIGGDEIEQAFKDLGVCYNTTYFYENKDKELSFGVYEISEDDFLNKLDSISEENWKDEWGWWRWSEGSNMGSVDKRFVINGHNINAWNEGISICRYDNLIDYLYNHVNISTETNICNLTVDLAKQNGLTLGELFNKYN